MNLIGYIRVSRVNGRTGESFVSPDLQREAIESYAKLHHHTIVDWKSDLDQPGSKLDRPEFQAALAALGRRDADGLIAAKLDRLTRSVADLGKLLETAKRDGWNLIAVDLGLDFRTSNGKLVANVLGSVAEWELDRRRESWAEAQAHAVERGVHIASRAPTGYRRGTDRRLELDPDTAPAVRELFRRRAVGEGWTALADFMTRAGVVTPYGNDTWTPGAVRSLLQNRAYLGEARSGRFRKEDAHDPLVTRGEWEAAHQASPPPAPRNGDPLMLSGLVRCGGCRYVLKPEKMRDRDGSYVGVYTCRVRHAAGRCETPSTIMARVLEPYVEAVFLEQLRGDSPIAVASASAGELDIATRHLDDAERELAAYLEATSAAEIGAQSFRLGLDPRVRRVDEAREALADAQRRSSATGLPVAPLVLVDAWPEMTTAEKRELLAAALDAVVIWPARGAGRAVPVNERSAIFWRGEAPDDLPRRGRRVPLRPWERPTRLKAAA